MPQFEPKYTDSDFLGVLDFETPKAIGLISKEVGCHVNTTRKFLKALQSAEKIKESIISGTNIRGWILNVESGN